MGPKSLSNEMARSRLFYISSASLALQPAFFVSILMLMIVIFQEEAPFLGFSAHHRPGRVVVLRAPGTHSHSTLDLGRLHLPLEFAPSAPSATK